MGAPAGGKGPSDSDVANMFKAASAPVGPAPQSAPKLSDSDVAKLFGTGGGAQAPAAPAKGKSGGSGIGGFLGRAVSGVVRASNPVNVVKGVGELGKEVGLAAGRGTENLINDVGFAATRPTAALGLGGVGGQNEKHLGGRQETPDFKTPGATTIGGLPLVNLHPHQLSKYVKANYPALHGVQQGVVQTGEEIRHPTQAAQNYWKDPVGSLLNDAVTASLALGPAAGAAKGLAAGTEDAAAAAEAAGNADRAAQLGARAETVGKVANVAEAAHGAASKVVLAPFRPTLAGLGLLADSPIGRGIADRLAQARENSKAAKEVQGTKLEAAAPVLETRREVGNVLKSTAGVSADEHAAALMRAQGMAPLMEHLTTSDPGELPSVTEAKARALSHIIGKIGSSESETPTVGAAHLAAVPTERVLAAEQAIRDASKIREEGNLAGQGMELGKTPLSPLQQVADVLPREYWPKTLNQPITRLEAVRDRQVEDAATKRETADKAAQRATKVEKVATGNSGMAAQERAAAVNAGAQDRATTLVQRGEGAVGKIIDQSIQRLYGEADPRVQLDKVRAEQEAAQQAHQGAAENFRQTNAGLLERERQATVAGSAAQRGDQVAAATGALAAGHPVAGELADVAQEAHHLRTYEGAAQKEADSAQVAHDKATVESVRDLRASTKAAVGREYQNLRTRLDEALMAGGPLRSADELRSMGIAPGGEYDAISEADKTLYQKMRSASASGAPGESIRSFTPEMKSGPDVWAHLVAQSLGMDPSSSVDAVVQEVQKLDQAVREFGKATQSHEALIGVLKRSDLGGGGSEDYYRALLEGSPKEAGQRMVTEGHLAPFDREAALSRGFVQAQEPPPLEPAEAVRRALTETPVRPQVADVAARLTPEELVAHQQALGEQVHSALGQAREGLPKLLSPTEMKAEAADRALKLMPSAEAEDRIASAAPANAWVRVRDALATDAEAADHGMRRTEGDPFGGTKDLGPSHPGFDGLSTHEQTLYRQVAGEDYANRTARELTEARDKVQGTFIDRGRRAGQVEGFRHGKAALLDRQANVAEARASRSIARVDDALARAQDDPRAVPAQFRTPMSAVREGMGVLKAAAAEATKTADTQVASQLAGIVNDLDPLSHIDYWKGREANVTHIQGTNTVDVNRSVTGERPQEIRAGGGRMQANKASRYRENISTNYTEKGSRALELNHWTMVAHNEFIRMLNDRDGSTIGKVLGPDARDMTQEKMFHAIRDQRMRAWDPAAKSAVGIEPGVTTLTVNTRVLPEAIHNELSRYYKTEMGDRNQAEAAMGLGKKALDKATNLIYRSPLSLSPRYLMMRMQGDALMTMVKGDVKPTEFPGLAARAFKMISSGQAPAAFERFLNDEPDASARFTRMMQTAPRMLDRMSRTMVFLKETDKGADFGAAVRTANEALGDYSTLGERERSFLARVFPIYPWAKTVAMAAAKLGADHPAGLLFAMHLGDMAGKDPKAFNPGRTAEELNPLSIFAGQPGSFVNPLIRGAAGALTGVNLSTMKPVSRPGQGAETQGPLAYGPGKVRPSDLLYYLANQIPAARLGLQSPASGLDQGIARYNTGEPILHKGKPLPAYVPGEKTPLGDFGSYWKTFLQPFAQPEPTPNPQGTTAQTKAAKTRQKADSTYKRELASLAKKGIR